MVRYHQEGEHMHKGFPGSKSLISRKLNYRYLERKLGHRRTLNHVPRLDECADAFDNAAVIRKDFRLAFKKINIFFCYFFKKDSLKAGVNAKQKRISQKANHHACDILKVAPAGNHFGKKG